MWKEGVVIILALSLSPCMCVCVRARASVLWGHCTALTFIAHA